MAWSAVFIVAGYLIGAIPFGLLIARLYGVPDIRRVGSGNIGATNVMRVLGFRAAIWVFLLDIGKGAGVVLAAGLAPQAVIPRELFLVLASLAVILGHVFSIYLGFKGGKGVSTAFGCLVVLLPVETLTAAVVFAVVALWSRYVSLASITAALALPLALAFRAAAFDHQTSAVYWAMALVLALLVPITHRQNIRRLAAGTEPRLSLGGKSSEAGSHA